MYLFSLDLAELEAIDGWEKLDPEDSDDMARVWSKGRVIKEDFEGIEIAGVSP